MRPETYFCCMETAAEPTQPEKPETIRPGRHFARVASAICTVQKAPCGGSHRMEPMHRPAPLDTSGMDRLAHGRRGRR